MYRRSIDEYAQGAINAAGVTLLISVVLFAVGVMLGGMSPHEGVMR